jgi:carotenoid cleavage dioxygenase-like enzyme
VPSGEILLGELPAQAAENQAESELEAVVEVEDLLDGGGEELGVGVVFMDLPAVFSIERAMDPAGGMPYVWSDTYGARLGVLRRDDPHGEIRWFDIDPCYVFHTLNSFEENDGQRLVLLGMRYPSLRDGATVATAAHLWRWTIDLTTGAH